MKTSDLARHEFIGLTIEVTKAKNKDLVGVKGRVIDETRNSFVLSDEKGKKIILKNQLTEFKVIEMGLVVDARLVMGRPEERIKVN